jgi:predicted RNA-binding protein YlxR (DUF448 family)
MSQSLNDRTCVGCGRKAQVKELFKFPVDKIGRHGYLCFEANCFEQAIKKRALERVLRRKLKTGELDEIKKHFDQQLNLPSADNHGAGSR